MITITGPGNGALGDDTSYVMIDATEGTGAMGARESSARVQWWIGAILIGIVVAILPLEFLVARLTKAEPYPAIFMPSFANVTVDGNLVAAKFTSFRLVDTAGIEHEIEAEDFLPSGGIEAYSLAVSIFAEPDRFNDPVTRDWLSKLLRVAFPAIDPAELVVVRQWDWYDERTGEQARSEVTSTLRITLEGGS